MLKSLWIFFVLTLLAESVGCVAVCAETQGIQARVTLQPPYYEPFESENFLLNVKSNLTLPQGLVTLPVDVDANVNDLLPSFDPTQGWCFDFNGVNSSFRIKNKNLEATPKTNQTLVTEFRVKFYPGDNASYGKDWFTLISNGGEWGKAPFALLFAWKDPNRVLTLIVNGTRQASVKTYLKDFVWYDLCVIFSDKKAEVLVDNAAIFSGPISSYPYVSHDDFFVGCLDKDIYPCKGCLQTVRVYYFDSDKLGTLDSLDSTPPSYANILVNLDMSSLYWKLLRRGNNDQFSPVLQTVSNSSSLVCRENVAGTYYYKVQLLDAANKTLGESQEIQVSVDITNAYQPTQGSSYLFGFILLVAIGLSFFLEIRRSH